MIQVSAVVYHNFGRIFLKMFCVCNCHPGLEPQARVVRAKDGQEGRQIGVPAQKEGSGIESGASTLTDDWSVQIPPVLTEQDNPQKKKPAYAWKKHTKHMYCILEAIIKCVPLLRGVAHLDGDACRNGVDCVCCIVRLLRLCLCHVIDAF